MAIQFVKREKEYLILDSKGAQGFGAFMVLASVLVWGAGYFAMSQSPLPQLEELPGSNYGWAFLAIGVGLLALALWGFYDRDLSPDHSPAVMGIFISCIGLIFLFANDDLRVLGHLLWLVCFGFVILVGWGILMTGIRLLARKRFVFRLSSPVIARRDVVGPFDCSCGEFEMTGIAIQSSSIAFIPIGPSPRESSFPTFVWNEVREALSFFIFGSRFESEFVIGGFRSRDETIRVAQELSCMTGVPLTEQVEGV
jgi:hypothetical protein